MQTWFSHLSHYAFLIFQLLTSLFIPFLVMPFPSCFPPYVFPVHVFPIHVFPFCAFPVDAFVSTRCADSIQVQCLISSWVKQEASQQ